MCQCPQDQQMQVYLKRAFQFIYLIQPEKGVGVVITLTFKINALNFCKYIIIILLKHKTCSEI